MLSAKSPGWQVFPFCIAALLAGALLTSYQTGICDGSDTSVVSRLAQLTPQTATSRHFSDGATAPHQIDPNFRLPSNGDINITIVTAASSNHFLTLYTTLIPSLAVSIADQDLSFSARIIVYDLAFSDIERQLLRDLEGRSITEVRRFPYGNFPAWFDVHKAAGEYAWKPVIIDQMLTEFGEPVLWIDSGTRLLPTALNGAYRYMNERGGFFTVAVEGIAERWLHPGMLEYFNNDTRFLDKRNCDASYVFVTPNPPVMRDIVGPWRACAVTRACIGPEGSDRGNHQQDQAALTYLAHASGIGCEHPNDYEDPVRWEDNFLPKKVDKAKRVPPLVWSLIDEMKEKGGDMSGWWQDDERRRWAVDMFDL